MSSSQPDYGDAEFSPVYPSAGDPCLSDPCREQMLSLIKKLSPGKARLEVVFDLDCGVYLESNVRSESDIFEAMQDEFSVLVPLQLMNGLKKAKLERVEELVKKRQMH